MATVTKTNLQNAKQDVQTISDVANGAADFGGDGLVHPRLGGDIKTLAKVMEELDSATVTTAAVAAQTAAEAARDQAQSAAATAAADAETAANGIISDAEDARDAAQAAQAGAEAARDDAQNTLTGLPLGASALSGQVGKLLKVNAAETGYELTAAPVEFYGLKVESDGDLLLDRGDGNFDAEDYVWYGVHPAGLTLSVNAAGHLMITT